jgi:hypothetical protein
VSTPVPQTQPTASSSTPTSVAGGVSQFMTTSTGGTGAYFGTVKNTSPNAPYGITGGSTYGPYDPSALVPLTRATPYAPLGASDVGKNLYIDTNSASNMYYNWTPAQQSQFRSKMMLVDSTYSQATDADLATAWSSLVTQSAAYHTAGKDVTPWDILAKNISSVAGKTGSKLSNADIVKNVTNTQLTSAPDSNAIFQAAAQSLIGRAPTADEMKAFQANLNSQERANPAQSQIETQYDANGNVQTQATTGTSGGVSDAAKSNLAQQDLRGTTEYANYQAATTYMGALQQLLGGGTV